MIRAKLAGYCIKNNLLKNYERLGVVAQVDQSSDLKNLLLITVGSLDKLVETCKNRSLIWFE